MLSAGPVSHWITKLNAGEHAAAQPTPAFAAQLAEEYQLLLGQLGDEQLRSIAVWKMEGYTTEEIAAKLDCAPRTVQRKLRMIRTLWKQEIAR